MRGRRARGRRTIDRTTQHRPPALSPPRAPSLPARADSVPPRTPPAPSRGLFFDPRWYARGTTPLVHSEGGEPRVKLDLL